MGLVSKTCIEPVASTAVQTLSLVIQRAPHQFRQNGKTQASVLSTVTLDSEAAVGNATGLTTLLSQSPAAVSNQDFVTEQRKDPELVELISFLERGELPADDRRAHRIVLQKPAFTMEHGMLIYIDAKQDHRKRVVIPDHLKQQILTEHHASLMGGHLTVKKTYSALVRHWWWDGMYSYIQEFTRNCPQCTVVTTLPTAIPSLLANPSST